MEKFVKPWRNRSKIVSNAGTALWTPKGDFRWCSAGGATVVLTETNLSALSNPERRTLQRLALLKLHTLSINCTIPACKGDENKFRKRLRRSLHRRKRSGNSGSSLLGRISGGKPKTGVFATSLDLLIKNENLAASSVSRVPRQARRESEPSLAADAREKVNRSRRASSNTPPVTAALKRQKFLQSKSSVSSSSLRSASSSHDGGEYAYPKRHSDSDSLLISHFYPENGGKRNVWRSQLLDALTLSSTSASASCLLEKPTIPIPSAPQVPSIVVQSIKYLEKYGLHALGIFRVAGSKKRLKQLREEFDNGLRDSFSEEDNAHDVAALFKEFIRCLPEPLLTRELYTSFLSTQRFKDMETQLNALKYLWYLLPDSNRDTLQYVLCFLNKVAKCAEDTSDENNQIIPGNKMTSRNLATLMGPNILHKVKSSQANNYVVENLHRAEEHDEVIDVTEDLIIHQEQLSKVSPEMHDQVMRLLLQTEPEAVDFILRRMAKSHLGEEINNIIKGSQDIINEIDDKETNARLAHRSNSAVDCRKTPARNHSVPGSNKQYSSTRILWSGNEHVCQGNCDDDGRCGNRCASVDAEFVKNYGLNPGNCISASEERHMRKQRSCIPLYTHSEPATPMMKYSSSFSYITPPPSPDSIPFKSFNSNSPNSSLSHSSTNSGYKKNFLNNNAETQNGDTHSQQEDASSASESRADSDIASEDFNDLDLSKQWLEWEAISKQITDEESFLDQETFV